MIEEAVITTTKQMISDMAEPLISDQAMEVVEARTPEKEAVPEVHLV